MDSESICSWLQPSEATLRRKSSMEVSPSVDKNSKQARCAVL